MHGIEVNRSQINNSENARGSELHLRRISIHYEDGGVLAFIPDAGHQLFAKDDVSRLAGLLHKRSSSLESSLEWNVETEGVADAEQDGGLA